jgi:radical SAM protein with 4Fe4S-binding SPASM domain
MIAALPALVQQARQRAPQPVLRRARVLRSLARAYRYWIPYNLFADGRAWPPTVLTLDLTYICNLKCEMCPQAIDFEKEESNLLSQYRSRRELTTEQLLCVIDDAAQFGVRTIILTGGEPFLRRDLLTLAARVKARGLLCQISTNGMLITPAIAAQLVEIGVDRVTVSVDGPEAIHNTVRKNRKSFQRLLQGVRQIQAEKLRQSSSVPALLFNCTVSASNVAHLGELMDVAGTLGININFSYMYYVTDAMEARTTEILQVDPVKGEDHRMPDALKRIDAGVLATEVAAVRRKEREYGTMATFSPDLPTNQVGRWYQDERHAHASKCFYAWQQARMNPYGDLYACGPISLSMGNVTEHGIAAIWNNDRYRQFRRLLRHHRLFPKCTKCCALNEKAWRYLPAVMR